MKTDKELQTVRQMFPKEWIPTKIDLKSGWKNNSKILYSITSAVNEDEYIEDESDFSEKLDYVLEFLKSKYVIHTPEELAALKVKWQREAADKAWDYSRNESPLAVSKATYLDTNFPNPS